MIRFHADERANRWCDLFEGTPGDVNLFVLKPGQVSAWHRHREQTDQFIVVDGAVEFGMYTDGDAVPNFITVPYNIGNKLAIHPGTWHGYKNIGETDALLLMYLSHKYEDGWDEERRTLEEMPWKP